MAMKCALYSSETKGSIKYVHDLNILNSWGFKLKVILYQVLAWNTVIIYPATMLIPWVFILYQNKKKTRPITCLTVQTKILVWNTLYVNQRASGNCRPTLTGLFFISKFFLKKYKGSQNHTSKISATFAISINYYFAQSWEDQKLVD